MKFFYADSLDLVDPVFDFETEKSRNPNRIPQRDDVYAHELMAPARPYDGILVSKALFRVGGGSVATGKYSQAQRKRFEREGARRFLRFPGNGAADPAEHPIMGDCGAFAYRNEPEPPYSVDEVIDFYEDGQFSLGISPDHLVLIYDKGLDAPDATQGTVPGVVPKHAEHHAEVRRRQRISLDNADEFLRTTRKRKVDFEPVGAAHGWSPASYQHSVRELVRMGYDYIALGGLVPKKTPDIADILKAVHPEARGRARLHLLGVIRPDIYNLMRKTGVVSFDSSSPIWQAFKDAKDNYYADGDNYTAVRIPQSNLGLPMRRIREGKIQQADAIAAERGALAALRSYGRHELGLDALIEALRRYDDLLGDGRKTRTPWARITRTLTDRPWESCPCRVCKELGVEIVLFRGANRNRRRGFHNLWWTQKQLESWRRETE
jgi:hypothetical protein